VIFQNDIGKITSSKDISLSIICAIKKRVSFDHHSICLNGWNFESFMILFFSISEQSGQFI
jgi:hypothetical protein